MQKTSEPGTVGYSQRCQREPEPCRVGEKLADNPSQQSVCQAAPVIFLEPSARLLDKGSVMDGRGTGGFTSAASQA